MRRVSVLFFVSVLVTGFHLPSEHRVVAHDTVVTFSHRGLGLYTNQSWECRAAAEMAVFQVLSARLCQESSPVQDGCEDITVV